VTTQLVAAAVLVVSAVAPSAQDASLGAADESYLTWSGKRAQAIGEHV
jgi:hypothetical protein